MKNTKVKISSIVESQLPLFVREEYPLVSELLTEYYRSLEFDGSVYDILQNIDQYVKVNNLTNLVESTTLESNVSFTDETVVVASTEGFPSSYGLIYLDNEIILYKSKTSTEFNNCVRGFSGITEFSVGNTEEFLFNSTDASEHNQGTSVVNLSSLFLKEFFIKIKKQFVPGFDNRDLYSGINQEVFLKQSKDFYTSKGTNRSFEILFRVLYGKDVEVILPKDYLIRPSDAQYRVTRNIVVESIEGNIEDLKNKTIFQDQYDNIPKSFGTVTDIEKIIKNEKEYFILKLDYDFDKDINVSGSIFGQLTIHPKTKVIDGSAPGTGTITVDSTIGFPQSGELLVSVKGVNILVTYQNKTINQFLNCDGIVESISPGAEVRTNTYAYGFSSQNQEIRFRITGVLSDVDLPDGSLYYEKNDIGRIITLGYNKNLTKDNHWIFNKTVNCNVSKFFDDGDFKYTIETYDNNGIYEGDSVEIDYIDKTTGERKTSIIDGTRVKIPTGSIPEKSFQITTSGFSISNIFSVKKIVSKFSNNFLTDVLNVYKDFNNDDLYVTSSSLPFYGSNPNIGIEDFKVILNGNFVGETLKIVNDGEFHGFITGDAIVYNTGTGTNGLGIQSGVYFVKKISDTEVKLSRSRSDINAGKFVGIGTTTITSSSNSTISLLSFSKNNNVPSNIDSQKIVRLLKDPINTGYNYNTTSGTTGVLINGVEILNYKSEDFIYYGSLKSVQVLSSGFNYDIINPPQLDVSSGISTSILYCGVEGTLEKINVIDGGFDYLDTPIITISGGQGTGASAIAKMIDYEHFIDLNPTSSNGNLNLIQNIIGFSTNHKFRDGELVVYKTGGSQSIGGLTTDAKYYVKVISDNKIKLHKSYAESLVGINTVDLTSFGVGNHRFESTTTKKKVSSVIITNKGNGYKNKKVVVNTSGINTSTNTITAVGNQYLDGETIYYYGGSVNISGLSTGSYILSKVDDSSFRLSSIGIGSTPRDFYYKTKQYIDLKSSGSGNHIFNYEPIEVKIEGKVGISTISNVDVTAKIQPIFRGEITSVFVFDGGVGYGSSEIINYNKQPNYNLNAGSGARLTPIISNGKIISVVINEKGNYYNSPPDLVVRGFGVGAQLTPIIENGQIVDVKIINGGINYDQKNTLIDVIVPGTGCELKFYPQVWTINNFSRLINTKKITSDDGVIYKGKNKNYGLQYSHVYSPRSLRKKVFCENIEDGVTKYKSDYRNDFDSTQYHSPLLGWAYDGNPIYGPYGYDSPSNNKVRQIISGYADPIDNQQNRPDKKIFPAGFFVEDFVFDNNGDLDVHNGRYCITPEYPNGTYAYFMTLSSTLANSGVFIGDKEPKFPYIIGNSYKSKPIEFNFDSKSNQDNFNFSGLIRNTNPYNTLEKNSNYEYILSSDDIKEQNLKVKNIRRGQVNSIKIISGGQNYKVGDKLIFDNTKSGGNGASARVEFLKGKQITGISQTTTVLTDVEFYPSSLPNRLIGFSTEIHQLKDNDFISIDSLSDYDSSIQKSFNVGVRSDNFVLSLGVGDTSVTGIVTYFYVSGLLDFPYIRENDILTVDSEDVKVLNVDKESSRIRVLRSQNSTVSSAHSAYSTLYENPRKFFIDLSGDLENKTYSINKEIYFDPSESLGIGSYIGFGHTITFSNPGIGQTTITIPQKSIYIKNHQLQTGDRLIYSPNSGIGISVSTNGTNVFGLTNNSILYVAKLSNDLIGISTVKVGLGTTGEFVGISQTASTLFLVGIGTGRYHSFKTDYDNVSKGNVVKNTVSVSLGSTHNLKINDFVYINSQPGISTTIAIRYSDYHRKLTTDPKYFSSVDIINNLITIQNHEFSTGDKLIHTSSSPAAGLEDQGIYYAIVYDKNRIKLSNSYFGATNKNQSIVNITSSSFGNLSKINPKIKVIKNQKVIFDLSDSSLSQVSSGVGRTSSFEFKLYEDSNFESEYFPINQDGTPKILKTGNIGISSNARIEFIVDSEFPISIYYNLIPITNLFTKNEYHVDSEVIESNKIDFVNSDLNGKKSISGITSNTFSFENAKLDNIDYSSLNGNFTYYTDSSSEFGEIERIKILSGGSSYQRLPGITTITSFIGTGAIVLPQSNTIGQIKSCKISDIGYDYSVDNTLKPLVKFPSILRVEPLSTLESIEVISPGVNYNTSPDLIVIDGFTNKVVDDIDLNYDSVTRKVNIVKNTKGLYNVTPKVIPINNSNGLGISSITYNSGSKIVTVFFTKQFSDSNTFPFSINDKVYIEGISVTNSSDKGYNSKNYNHSTFSVVGVSTNLGGSGSSLQYSLSDYLDGSENPGIFDPENSSGRVISESSFPTFNIKLTKNSFILGEEVESNSVLGNVLKWDSFNEYLNVEVTKDFSVGDLIVGKTSKSQAFIREILTYESFYEVNSSSRVENNWNRETGFLNNDLQRTQDSDYYQQFSYSLKSEISVDKWNDVVSNLNHTLGFKKFSDLIVNSIPEISGISTDQNNGLLSATSDLNSIVDVDCVSDYDLVSENSFYVDETLTSDEISFNSAILQDYSESIGNRVLTIDDISKDFNTSVSRTFVTSFNI